MLNNIFKSATIRLTTWSLAIIMTISIMFSFTIYEISTAEIHRRLDRFYQNITSNKIQVFNPAMNRLLNDSIIEAEENAKTSLTIQLIYVNSLVLIIGGIGSYILARQSLRPIEIAHEKQSRFTSDASHELRTPLAVMRTEIELVTMNKNATKDELVEVLTSNLEEVDKLSKLSEMLLNLSQLENSKIELDSINLAKVTKSVIDDYKICDNRVLLKVKKAPHILGNEIAISDLVKILVDNALQYSPIDSLININISSKDGKAIFEISNPGKGIPADKLPHVFDRFFRSDSSRTCGDKKGYGLGLALAKNIVELHSGDITVTSEVDNLTTFKLILPLKKTVPSKK